MYVGYIRGEVNGISGGTLGIEWLYILKVVDT